MFRLNFLKNTLSSFNFFLTYSVNGAKSILFFGIFIIFFEKKVVIQSSKTKPYIIVIRFPTACCLHRRCLPWQFDPNTVNCTCAASCASVRVIGDHVCVLLTSVLWRPSTVFPFKSCVKHLLYCALFRPRSIQSDSRLA